ASAAMPMMREDLSATLVQAGLYLSVISVMAGLTGAAFGPATERVGTVRAGIAGLTLMAVASIAAAFAPTAEAVFAFRVVEAIGLPLVVTAMPTLVQLAAGSRHRDIAL